MLDLKQGLKIVVYDGTKIELGEGTLIAVCLHRDMNLTAYECEEHTILAKGDHYVRLHGKSEWNFIAAP